MSNDVQLIAAPALPAEKFVIRAQAIELRDTALSDAALIGRVENAAQNEQCVAVRKRIKGLRILFEAERKKLKEPVLEFGRQLDRTVAATVLDLEKEDARLEGLEKDFIRAEQARVREEEAAQRRELDRIEQERQAQLASAKTEEQKQLINENADARAYVESRPVEISRAKGQAVKKIWVIDRINDFQLMRARPDLVRKVEFDMVALKAALDEHGKLPGVEAHEDINVQARGSSRPEIVNV